MAPAGIHASLIPGLRTACPAHVVVGEMSRPSPPGGLPPPKREQAANMKPIRLALLLAVLVLWAPAPARAQLTAGTPAPPFTGPGPTVPGLYAGVKDQQGVAVSWVRVQGIKDRGDLVAYVRGKWGQGLVEVPLTDVSDMEFVYTEGRIQADVRLLTGETMQMQLENPFTELSGFWRQNPYSVPLAGIRQVWFRYVSQEQLAPEYYVGTPQNLTVEGVVTSLELHGNGGFLTVEGKRGEAVNLRFDYARLHSGIDLLLNKAPWMVGRSVKVLYRLTSDSGRHALREIRDMQLGR